jgi:phenol 2-monooxygenase
VFDTKVIYQQSYTEVEPGDVPRAFKPVKVPFGIEDVNQIFASGHGRDIFRDREISKQGAIVVVRPDQYVAGVFPIDAHEELAAYFDAHMLPMNGRQSQHTYTIDGQTFAGERNKVSAEG